MENILNHHLNAKELKNALEQIESQGYNLEDFEVLLVIDGYLNDEHVEGYAPSATSTLHLREGNYFRIKAFRKNKSVYK